MIKLHGFLRVSPPYIGLSIAPCQKERLDFTSTALVKGTREIQMKTLYIFILLFIEYRRYTMTSFFYVVSSACNTSVPAFRKCMDASINKNSFG